MREERSNRCHNLLVQQELKDFGCQDCKYNFYNFLLNKFECSILIYLCHCEYTSLIATKSSDDKKSNITAGINTRCFSETN